MERLRNLSLDDQKDLIELLQELSTTQEEDEKHQIALTFKEIISNEDYKLIPLSTSQPFSDEAKRWLRSVASNIKNYRMQLGLTQADLAKKADLPQEYIVKLENAEVSLSHTACSKITKALNISPFLLEPLLA